MKVSIIVNNFNYGRFLAAAIESALSQTYSDCEVIVVDDGSTDNSRDVLERFAGRVQILLKENGGQASAFNAGFRVSTGELIAFLDADDALFPEAIERTIKAAKTNFAKVQFPLEIIDSDGQMTCLRMPRGQLSQGNLLSQFLKTGRYSTSPTSGNLFSRQFLERIFPIPEDEFETADGYINTCAPFHGEIVALDQPLGFYRIHGKSMTTVTHAGAVDVSQIQRLVRHAAAEKLLLERMAENRGLRFSKGALSSHWTDVKLRMALERFSRPASVIRLKSLLGAAFHMSASIVRAGEVTAARKLQHIVWAFGVAMLPARQAAKFIEYAFDHAPHSHLSRLLRKM